MFFHFFALAFLISCFGIACMNGSYLLALALSLFFALYSCLVFDIVLTRIKREGCNACKNNIENSLTGILNKASIQREKDALEHQRVIQNWEKMLQENLISCCKNCKHNYCVSDVSDVEVVKKE